MLLGRGAQPNSLASLSAADAGRLLIDLIRGGVAVTPELINELLAATKLGAEDREEVFDLIDFDAKDPYFMVAGTVRAELDKGRAEDFADITPLYAAALWGDAELGLS
jgi:hypothetical protein